MSEVESESARSEQLPDLQSEQWYIVKSAAGPCRVVSAIELAKNETPSDITETWGPFGSKGEAIARRVGLIRSGKCQPV